MPRATRWSTCFPTVDRARPLRRAISARLVASPDTTRSSTLRSADGHRGQQGRIGSAATHLYALSRTLISRVIHPTTALLSPRQIKTALVRTGWTLNRALAQEKNSKMAVRLAFWPGELTDGAGGTARITPAAFSREESRSWPSRRIGSASWAAATSSAGMSPAWPATRSWRSCAWPTSTWPGPSRPPPTTPFRPGATTRSCTPTTRWTSSST